MADPWVSSPVADLPNMSSSGLPDYAIWRPTPGNQAATAGAGMADRGVIMPGIRAGLKEGVGALGSVAGAIGNVTGIRPLQSFGDQLADQSAREVQEVGRPDLEGNPFTHGLGQILPRLGYQAAKMAPSLGVMAALAPAIPEELVAGTGLAALGKVVPRIFGGGAGLAEEAAAKAGMGWGTGMLAGTAVMAPQQTAGMYEQARQAAGPEGPSATSAALSLGTGIPLGAAASIAPAGAGSLLKGPIASSAGVKAAIARMATAGGANAAAGAIQGGISTGIDQMFGPDIPMADRMKGIVDNAMTGAALGGFLGVMGGIRRENPANVSIDDLKNATQDVAPSGDQGPPKQLMPPSDANAPPVRTPVVTAPGSRAPEIPEATPNTLMQETLRKQAGLADANGARILPDNPLHAVIDNMTATNPASARVEIESQINALEAKGGKGTWEDKPPSPALAELGKQYGILNERGVPYDTTGLEGALDTAERTREALAVKASKNPGFAKSKADTITAADDAVTKLKDQITLRDQAETLKQAAPVEDTSATIRAMTPEEEAGVPAQTPLAATQEDTHALIKEMTGKTRVPKPLLGEDLQNEGELRAYVTARITKDGDEAPAYIKTLSEKLATREDANAAQEPGTEGVDARQPSGDGSTVGEGNSTRPVAEATGDGEIAKAQENIPLPDRVEAAVKADVMAKAGTPEFEAAAQQADLAARDVARTQNGRSTVQPPPADPFALPGEPPRVPPDLKSNAAAELQLDEKGLLSPEMRQDYLERLQQAVNDPDALPVFQRGAEQALNDLKAGAPGAEGAAARVLAHYDGVQFMQRPETSGAPLGDAAFGKTLNDVSSMIHPDRMNSLLFAEHPGELPEAVLQQAAKLNMAPGDIRGAYYQGKQYVVRSALKTPADLQEAILHEVQHGVNKAALGPDHQDVMEHIFDKAGGAEGILATARRFGPDVEKQLQAYLPDGPMSAKDKAAFADEMFAQVAGKATGKFQNALMAWAGDMKQALIGFLRGNGMSQLADRFDKFTAVDTAKMLRDMRQADAGLYSKNASDAAYLRSVPGQMKSLGNFQDMASQAKREFEDRGLGLKNLADVARSHALFWMAPENIKDLYQRVVPSIGKHLDAGELGDNINARVAQMHGGVAKEAQAFREQGLKTAALQDRMLDATSRNIDPSKTWAQHTWLHDDPNARALKGEVDAANNEFTSAFRQAGGIPVYTHMKEASQSQMYSEFAAHLQNAMRNNEIPTTDIGREFRDNTLAHESSGEAMKFWASKFKEQGAAIDAQIVAQKAEAAVANPKTKQAMIDKVAPLEQMLSGMRDYAAKATTEAPYFHLGRDGGYVVSGKIRTLEDGITPDPKAIAEVQRAALAAGFDNISLKQASNSAQFFARLENRDVGSRLHDTLAGLQKTGAISSEDGSLWQGPRENLTAGQLKGITPQWIQSAISAMEANFKDNLGAAAGGDRDKIAAAQMATLQNLKALALDIMPDRSLAKVMTERKGTQGYNTDMLSNFVQRGQTSSRAVAQLLTAGERTDAMTSMINEAKALRSSGASDRDIMAAHQVVAQLIAAQAAVMKASPKNSFLSTLGAMTHAWALGFSPAYTALVMSQNWTLGVPELAKHAGIGFVAASKATAANTPMAFKIMAAVARSASAAEGTITSEALKGVPKGTADFIMQAANRGWIEIGGFTRTMGTRAAGGDEGKTARLLRLASATAGYSENLSRIISVLAARDVYKGPPEGLMDFVGKTTKTSMMVWGGASNPMAFGPGGVAGKASPLVTKFMGYQMRVIPLIYKNVLEAFHGNGASPAEALEAQKFLLGHLAVTTALGGALGLPAAGAFAGAATRVSGLFNQGESFDVEQHIRNFFSDMFGDEIGTVLANGLPRALGFDASHFSDADMAPFTRLLEDRRKMEDALPDWAEHAMGAPFGMVSSMYLGLRDLARGVNPMIALQGILPSAMRNPFTAYRMSQYGYVDHNMNKLPMEPTAQDILARAIGFTPAREARYKEDKAAQTGRSEEMKFRSGLIEKNYAIAAEQGDVVGQQKALAQMKEFAVEHPGVPAPAAGGKLIASRASARGKATASGLPLGVSMQDISARQLTRPHNY